jgi:uncharacterized protein GlcG (DUF336 family)
MHLHIKHARAALAVLFVSAAFGAVAQVPSYGTSINLEQAKKAIAAAQAEARKNNWPVAVAVVDTHGSLIAFEKMDDTQTASVQVAIDKASSAAIYRRPTKVFEDLVAGGGAGTRVMNLRGASTVDGGLPIVVGGKVVGGIGTSGVAGNQDAVVSKAGADALK